MKYMYTLTLNYLDDEKEHIMYTKGPSINLRIKPNQSAEEAIRESMETLQQRLEKELKDVL